MLDATFSCAAGNTILSGGSVTQQNIIPSSWCCELMVAGSKLGLYMIMVLLIGHGEVICVCVCL